MATFVSRDLTSARYLHGLTAYATEAGDTALVTALAPYVKTINIYTDDLSKMNHTREELALLDGVDVLGSVVAETTTDTFRVATPSA